MMTNEDIKKLFDYYTKEYKDNRKKCNICNKLHSDKLNDGICQECRNLFTKNFKLFKKKILELKKLEKL